MEHTKHQSSPDNSIAETSTPHPLALLFGGPFVLLLYYVVTRSLLENSPFASVERFRLQWKLFFVGVEEIKFLELHWIALALAILAGWNCVSQSMLNAYTVKGGSKTRNLLARVFSMAYLIPWFLFYACGSWLASQYALNAGVPSGAAHLRGASSWVYPVTQIPVCIWEFRDRSIAQTVNIYLGKFAVHPSSIPERTWLP